MLFINRNVDIRERFSKGFVRYAPVTTLVIHGTAGGGTLNWMRNGGNDSGANYSKNIGLFHYLIERRGACVEVISPDFWVYHSSCGRADHATIGVELENLSPTNADPYTKEQYDTLNELIAFLVAKYPKLKKFHTHRFRSAHYSQSVYGEKGKNCPGEGFDYRKIKHKFEEVQL